jgi:hypothetical protein
MASTFLSADELADRMLSEGIPVSAERLVEMANAGLIPHARVDDGPPLFRKAETKRWILDNLVYECTGRPLSTALSVFNPSTWSGQAAGVPMELEPMAEWLREFPVGMLRPTACVYFLVRKGRIVYVGMSDSLYSRITDHLKDKAFDRVLFLRVLPDEMSTVESAFIRIFKPAYNAPRTHEFLTDEIAAGIAARFTVAPDEGSGDAGHAHIIEKQSRRIGAMAKSINIIESENAELRSQVSEARLLLAEVTRKWTEAGDYDDATAGDRVLRAKADFQIKRR